MKAISLKSPGGLDNFEMVERESPGQARLPELMIRKCSDSTLEKQA